MSLPFALPPLEAVLLRSRQEALSAFVRAGWRLYATPISLDAERRRLLNIDLTEPDVAWPADGALLAVAHVESDRGGRVTHLELTAGEPVDAQRVADAVLSEPGDPRVGGGAEAREWVWGPETGSEASVGGEPVRLWIAAEKAYGDRLWMVASLVRRS